MRKIYLIFMGILLCMTPMAAQDFPSELASDFQIILDNQVSNSPVKGLAASIILPDGSQWTGWSGVSTGSEAIDTSRLFNYGSQRHQLVSVTVLKLQEEGLLSIEDSIGKYLPNLNQINTHFPIKKYMNQTSGAGEYWDPGNPFWGMVFGSRETVWSLPEVAQYIPESESTEDPSYIPRNTNHLVLALLIEEVTGNPVGDEINTRILEPLGLTSSIFPVSDFNENLLNGVWQYNAGSPNDFYGLSQDSYLTSRVAWCAKIQENVQFTRALHSGNVLTQELTEILYQETPGSKETLNYPFENLVETYGNGVQMMEFEGTKVVGHGGNGLNMGVSFHFPEENLSLSLVSNMFDSQFEIATLFKSMYTKLNDYMTVSAGPDNSLDPGELKVYPNPASDWLHIDAPGTQNQYVRVFNATGSLILEERVSGPVNVSGLNSGIYFVTLTDKNRTLTTRFVKH